MKGRETDVPLWNMLRGALGTRALAIVAELRVADALASGPRPVDELAAEVGADSDTLRRLLRALASDGIFAEDDPGTFRNTPTSELLQGDGWRDFALLFGGVWYQAAERLGPNGDAAFPRRFDTDFWSWLADHPVERASFDRSMETGKSNRVERLVALDWRDGELVVDVGGGSGSLLLELFARRPGLRGIVFDLPETNRDESTYPNGVEFVAGDFFEELPRGDTYLLSTILHDWDDASAVRILRTIRAAAAPGARLVALDAVVPDGNEPHGAKWLDLLMLVLFAGRERDEAQWRALLAEGGFTPVSIEDGLVQAVRA